MGFISARKASGLSQVVVAEQLGVTDAAVSMWETGKTKPRTSLLTKIAALYCCSVDDLLSPDCCDQEHSTT
ncbi:putative Xre family DNA-binding protein [uncultured Eubacteriales bacterium]|uniref:Putative Xre family DNA-binding protein n=1 Tax=uncultured Eubacteriales bacterium TaxID=172733 RepID=A0A212J3H1_9FIRM|nr:putative Xre family DNA-binding protein [uncultured Eubacteriales bacterium]